MLQRDILKFYRKERKLSQQQLCAGICPRTTYATFEKHGFSMSSDILFQLLDRLNVRLDEFDYQLQGKNSPKDVAFIQLSDAVQTKDVERLRRFANDCWANYQKHLDLTWLVYTLKATEQQLKIAGDFDPLRFKAQHQDWFKPLLQRLDQITHWQHFEFSLFANLIIYLSTPEISRTIKKMEQTLDFTKEANQILFIKAVVNCAVRLLEYEEYSLVQQILEKSTPYTTAPEYLHYRVMARYFQTLSHELQYGRGSLSEYQFLAIYSQVGLDGHRQTLLNHRKRLLKAKKAGFLK